MSVKKSQQSLQKNLGYRYFFQGSLKGKQSPESLFGKITGFFFVVCTKASHLHCALKSCSVILLLHVTCYMLHQRLAGEKKKLASNIKITTSHLGCKLKT